MSGRQGIIAEVQCPFFRALRSRTIVCESLIKGAETSCTFFATESKKAAHLIWHCNEKDGAGCPVYAALMGKYRE